MLLVHELLLSKELLGTLSKCLSDLCRWFYATHRIEQIIKKKVIIGFNSRNLKSLICWKRNVIKQLLYYVVLVKKGVKT